MIVRLAKTRGETVFEMIDGVLDDALPDSQIAWIAENAPSLLITRALTRLRQTLEDGMDEIADRLDVLAHSE